MSYSNNLRVGGLRLEQAAGETVYRAPRTSGPAVSWLHKTKVSDDQGSEGACAIFAMASWAEIMFGLTITNAERLGVYSKALAAAGRPAGDGLAFKEAHAACVAAGWIPANKHITPAYGLDDLHTQPLVAGFAITPNWALASKEGCLDHEADARRVCGYHAVVIVGYGPRRNGKPEDGNYVFIENSWGESWGWHSIGFMHEQLFGKLCREMWRIV